MDDPTLTALAAGERVAEREFDLIFPKDARKLSRTNWTPLAAARRAAALLVERPGARVLDVGAGAGKLCIVGALTTTGEFTGVESDAELAHTFREVVASRRVPRVRLVHGDALSLDWSRFDALYLFNPFTGAAPDERSFLATVAAVTAKLAALPAGTVVVTYHGFGGTMPPELREEHAEFVGPGVLQRWRAGP